MSGEVKQIGNIVDTGNWDNPQRGRIYSADGICPALNTVGGGGLEPKIIEDFYKNREPRVYDETAPTIRAEREGLKVIVASRGRNPDNSSDRTAGSPTEQRLEPNSEGICNTLTTVQKDNMVLEPNELQFIGGLGNKDRVGDGKELSRNFPQGERVYSSQGIGCSQTAQGGGTGSYTGLYLHDYRIRKLTPKECWRLMAFTDEDFHKAEQVNSNTQLYKQAGNAICVNVLEEIFKKLL